jgi:hypothetical protein
VLTPVPHVTEHDEDETGIADHWYEMGAGVRHAAVVQLVVTTPLPATSVMFIAFGMGQSPSLETAPALETQA